MASEADVQHDQRASESAADRPYLPADPAFREAQWLAGQGNVAQALRIYAQIGIRQAERHYHDALLHERRGAPQFAVACLKKAVAAHAEYRLAWAKLAVLQTGKDAETAYRRVLAVAPDDFDARIGLAQLLMQARRLHEAAEALEGLLPNADIRFILAHLLWQLGDFPQTEHHLRLYLQVRSDDARAYATLIELLGREDRLEEADALCREYVEGGGRDVGVCVEWVRLAMRREQWADAEAILDALRVEESGDQQLCLLHADFLEKTGQFSAARARHQKNIELAPRYLEFHLQWADFEYRCGEYKQADAVCQNAARWLSESPEWGFRELPEGLESRLIFHSLPSIAADLCTGQRALIDRTGINPATKTSFGDVVEFFCMVSGQGHVDFLETVAFPALVSSEGFELLLSERRCVYNIYTTPTDFPALQGFLAKLDARGIAYRVNVELLGLSQNLYTILALPIIDQVKRSLLLQSIVVMALPDAIIAGSVRRVINDMRPHETVVCAMPRIDSDIAYPELKAHFAGEDAVPLETRDFVRRSMTEFRHPQTYSALVSDTPCLHYRDQGTYYSAHNWAPPPLCFHAREELLEHMLYGPLCGPNSIASFYAVDHDFVDSAWRNGTLRLIDNSDYFFWAEFTGPARHTEFLAGRKAEGYYYPPSARVVFEHEFKWIYG